MDKRFAEVIARVEPLADSLYGPRYRCALTLEDGTHVPCAILQSRPRLIQLARRRIKEELSGKGVFRGPDPYGQILSMFVAGGNKINELDVVSAAPSPYAPPISLLNQLQDETTMGWTGWVFQMKDSRMFQYASSFRMEFLNLPDGYTFDDVTKVYNHSYVRADGSLGILPQGGQLPADYDYKRLFRERTFFTCYLEDL